MNKKIFESKIDTTLLNKALTCDITGKANSVLIGLNWTVVIGPQGLGLAHTPKKGTNGCVGLPISGSYTGKKLVELAKLVASDCCYLELST